MLLDFSISIGVNISYRALQIQHPPAAFDEAVENALRRDFVLTYNNFFHFIISISITHNPQINYEIIFYNNFFLIQTIV